jgi:hypothetical protein
MKRHKHEPLTYEDHFNAFKLERETQDQEKEKDNILAFGNNM